MRIGIGCVLLTDLITRSLSIKAFFTDEGVLPLEILKLYNWNPYYFSFHALSGELWWQIILFIINTGCIILLIIGYRTRFITFVCWVLLTSLQNRNPFILQGGDDFLRLILLWGIFLPWGERYSIKKVSEYATSYFSISTIGFMLLTISVFLFSALLKTSPEWHSEGTALYYALSLDQIRLPFGTFLYQFPALLTPLTHIVWYIELIGPLLIICPFLPYRFRLIGIISILLLFLGIVLCLYVGLFYIISITSLIGLLPSPVMNWFEKKFYKEQTEIIENVQLSSHKIYELFTISKNIFLSLIIAYCLLLNLGSVKKFPYTLDHRLFSFGSMFRLEQNWGMFSPYILKDDGYFVYSGYDPNKHRYIDIKHTTDSVSFKKPDIVVNEYESDRWRKYAENYVFNNNNYMRPYFCKYLIKKWNKEHPKNYINDLTIFFMKEVSLPNYQTKPIEKLAVCNCQDN